MEELGAQKEEADGHALVNFPLQLCRIIVLRGQNRKVRILYLYGLRWKDEVGKVDFWHSVLVGREGSRLHFELEDNLKLASTWNKWFCHLGQWFPVLTMHESPHLGSC